MRLSVAPRFSGGVGSRASRPDTEAVGAFTERVGGFGSPPFDSLNMALHVGDDPATVLQNRRRALGALGGGFGLDDLVVGQQVHGSRVERVGREHAGRGAHEATTAIAGADALITATPGLVLCVLVADCVPLLLYDARRGAIGAVHSGWRGTAAGIARRTVQAMAEAFGSRPLDIIASIGPSIGPKDYAVGQEVIEAVGREYAGSTARGEPSVDLRAANRDQLIAAGVAPDRIEIAIESTASCTDRYFSYRAAGGPTGRTAGLIVLC